MSSLFETLENEFCPPLDSSLLAALLAEVEVENAQKPLTLSSPEIESLRNTLRELAAHADAAQLTELADLSLTSPTEDTFSSPDFGFGGITADTSFSSQSSSASSDHSFSSPLGFLQAALPDAPLSALKKALKHAEKDGKELDMWDLVASILSTESIRELEERGLNALDEQDGIFREEDVQWEIVTPRNRKTRTPTSPVKRKQGRGSKITLIDIRQQNHGKPRSKSMSKPPLPDLWTQASSIATNIATFLPPQSPSFFLSYLHSPKYETPYLALCAALEDLSDAFRNLDEDSEMLLTLLDILSPQYEPLDSEQRSRLVHETQLAIRATNGRGDDVLDIVELLRELDSDFSSSKWELGIYHLPPQRPPPSPIITTGPKINSSPKSPLDTPKASSTLVPLTSQTTSEPKVKSDPYQWQTVPARPVPDDSPHPLAQIIAAYAQTTASGRKVKGGGNGYGKGGKGDVGEMPHFQTRIQQHRLKQEEYLKQAAKMWQRGDKKSRGGEIAFYYAEKAREFQELAKQEALENARIMVYAKRSATGKYDEIDLHGTTAFEAVTIVKEVLQETKCSPSQPFKIITGKGSHSVNKVGILKPAIRNALVEEGWVLGSWEGGLVVRGRNS